MSEKSYKGRFSGRIPSVKDILDGKEESVPERTRPSVVDPPKDKDKPKTTRARTTSRTRTPKPPTRISPGWAHKAAATKILQSLQSRITQETGEEFNIGEIPSSTELAKEGNIIDERPPVELLSRIIAHIMHRIPGVRNIEKKLEGKDSSSGFFSDLAAFFAQLYTLNEDTFDAVRHQMMEQARAKNKSKNNGGVSHDVPV